MASSRAVGVSRPRSAARTSGTRRHLHTFRLARCSPFRPLHFQLLIWKRKKKPAGRGSNPNRGCSGPARARALRTRPRPTQAEAGSTAAPSPASTGPAGGDAKGPGWGKPGPEPLRRPPAGPLRSEEPRAASARCPEVNPKLSAVRPLVPRRPPGVTGQEAESREGQLTC